MNNERIQVGYVEASSRVQAPNLIYNTGDQTISGAKSFTNNLILQDNLLQISQASGYLTGVGYSGNYNGGYFLGRTKLSQNTSRLVDSSFGNTWVAKDSNRNWLAISISSDGKYQSAVVDAGGQIYVSSDYGSSWAAKDSNRTWYDISISSDGKYQSAVVNNGQIYVSSDYGNTWAVKDSSRSWQKISISSDGKYQSATVNAGGQIYVSSDYGNSWAPKDSNRNWNGISISSDGKYQSATVAGGQIYVSSDYGNSWVAKAGAFGSWRYISISSDGKYQTATNSGIQIYVSSDYGNSWAAKDSNRNWLGISISSDGKYQSATVYNGQIYASSDYGNSWVAKESNRAWYSISISSDGKYQSAVVIGGQIYVSKTDELIDGSLYADNLIYNTGNQTISGVKNFATGIAVSGNLQVSGTGIFNSLDLNNIDNISLSGVDVTITSGVVSLTNPLSAPNLVYNTGDQTISGIKTFDTGIFNKASGNFILFNSATAPSSPAKGQLWFDTVGNNFSGYNGTSWLKLNN